MKSKETYQVHYSINNGYACTICMKFINPKVLAVAHKQDEGATKHLRVYKFHR